MDYSLSAHGANKAAARIALEGEFSARVMANLPALDDVDAESVAVARNDYMAANMRRADVALDALEGEPREGEVVHVHMTADGCSAKHGPM